MVSHAAIPPLVMAGVNAGAGLHHLGIYLRRRRSREHLSFAALAFAVAGYCVCSASLVAPIAPPAAWEIAQTGLLALGALAFVTFLGDYTGRPTGRLRAGLAAAYAVVFSAAAAFGWRLLWTDVPVRRTVLLPAGASVGYIETAAGPLMIAFDVVSLAAFVAVSMSIVALARRGDRRRAANLGLASALLFVTAVNDACVGLGLVNSLYTIEYGFLGLIVVMGVAVDDKLLRTEGKYREVFDATNDAIFVHDPASGVVLDANRAMADLYGYEREEALGLVAGDLSANRPPFTEVEARERIRLAVESGPQVFEWLARRKGGEEFWVEVSLRSSRIGGSERVLAVVRDIGERRRAAEALRLSDERLRSMAQQSYDFTTVIDAGGTITYATPSASRLLGLPPDGLVGRNAFAILHPEDVPHVREAFERTARGAPTGVAIQFRVRHADGSWVWIEGVGSDQLRSPSISGILLNSRDITARKRAEAEVARKLRELTVLNAVAAVCVGADREDALLERATAIIGDTLFPDDCGVLLVDEAAGVLRYAPGYRPHAADANREPIALGTGITGSVARSGIARREAEVTAAPDYLEREPAMRSEICVPLKLGARVIGVIDAEAARPAAFTAEDESLLVTLAAQLATAIGRLRAAQAHRESEERFRRLSEAAFEGIGITDQGVVLDANSQLAEMFGYTVDEMRGRAVMEFVAPESADAVAGLIRRAVDTTYEHMARRKDGSVFPVETQGKPLAASGGTMRVAAVRDITERKHAEDRIKRQLERLAALHAIDSAISGGMGLSDMLTLALDQVVAQLRVDAADVLLLDPDTQLLEPAASIGFRSPFAESRPLPPGESSAGRALASRRTILDTSLAAEGDASPRARLLLEEGFLACCAAPLVAKDAVCGALEVFCRRPLAPDQEWLDYFGTLAGQLAIAIENRALVSSLRRSNAELADAYDTTLAGWSHALELRDRETHGHTERVVRLTLDLARSMGVDEGTLVHMRRGALLHDIGKMGIPDTILLKAGPLTREEWEVMRQHPRIALDLLEPIAFLGPALDIPCYHHERWDGSGYPHGLAGELIPRAARIFAVVDAWDALRVARPYRDAWSEDEVQAYLREEAGRQFDPAVVERFLGMLQPAQPAPNRG